MRIHYIWELLLFFKKTVFHNIVRCVIRCSFVHISWKSFETWMINDEWHLRKALNSHLKFFKKYKDKYHIIVKFISTASFGNSNRKQDLIYQNSFFKKTWFHTFVTYVIQSSFQQLALKFQRQKQRLDFSSEILQNVWKDNFISLWDMWQ